MGADAAGPRASASAVVEGNEVIVPLAGLVDFEAELARLDKELGKVGKEKEKLEAKLANESFVSRAPADIVAKERARSQELAETQEKLESLRKRLADAMD
jgi:valyl-tRNA synthetase